MLIFRIVISDTQEQKVTTYTWTHTDSGTVSTQAHNGGYAKNLLYEDFDPNNLTDMDYNQWIKGTTCINLRIGVNLSLHGGVIFCPMPWDPLSLSACCGPAFTEHCCEPPSKDRWVQLYRSTLPRFLFMQI